MTEGREARIVGPGEGASIAVTGDVYRFLATSGDTNNRYAIWHATVYPGGGPPPHIHRREEEGFYVLEGEVTFRANGVEEKAGPGTFLNLPVGSLHSFTNQTNAPAKMLILVAPGGLEKMFEEAGTPHPNPEAPPPPVSPEEIEKILAVAPRYGIEIQVP